MRAALFAFVLSLGCCLTSVTHAQCRVSGTGDLYDVLPNRSPHRVSVRGHASLTLTTTEVTLEASRPILFAGTTSLANVALALRESTILEGMIGVAVRTRFAATSIVGSDAIGTLNNGEGLLIPNVRVPCDLLTLFNGGLPETTTRAPIPMFRPRPNWIPSTTSHSHTVCHAIPHGSSSCQEVDDSPCQAIGDASECGYHAVAATHSVSLFAAPRQRGRSVQVQLDGDMLLRDHDGRQEWLLVQSMAPHNESIIVRGWVRRSEVLWRQATPRYLTMGVGRMGTIGASVHPNTRVGYVDIIVNWLTPMVDQDHNPFASIMDSYCTPALLPAGSPWVEVRLPGELSTRAPGSGAPSRGYIAATSVAWVTTCAR